MPIGFAVRLMQVLFPFFFIAPLLYAFESHSAILLYESGQSPSCATAELLNAEATQEVVRSGEPALEIERGCDPYQKVEWILRFKKDLPRDWKSFVLEIEFFDEGVGVIQPMLLRDDRFAGEWAGPFRSVSFTRLNTQQVRRALFEFMVPHLEWENTKNAHLKIAGLQYLKTIRAFSRVEEEEWVSRAAEVPVEVTPMVKLKRPMEITCTVGIEDVGDPPSLENSLNNIREYAPVAKVLGFTSVECFVRWDLLEPRPGEFDFSHYDRIVEAIVRRGLKWYPNLVITSAFALPPWYFENQEDFGFTCLEHGLGNQVPSIWNAANREHVSRVLKAFGEHYEPMGVLEAVRLGPSGNFGEAQFPAGAGKALGYRGQMMHAHIGWWAGDSYAKEDFRRFLKQRYGKIENLNTAWQTEFGSFAEIEPQLPETYRTNQGRLDMTGWYTDSMTEWCDFWAKEARKVDAEHEDLPILRRMGIPGSGNRFLRSSRVHEKNLGRDSPYKRNGQLRTECIRNPACRNGC